VKIEPSLWGRFVDFVYHPALLKIAESDNSGRSSLRFRFVPGMAASMCLLSPHLQNNEDASRLWSGENHRVVRYVAFEVDGDHPRQFKPRVRIRLYHAPGF